MDFAVHCVQLFCLATILSSPMSLVYRFLPLAIITLSWFTFFGVSSIEPVCILLENVQLNVYDYLMMIPFLFFYHIPDII